MLLLAPWADTSRSYSGSLQTPNWHASVYRNRHSDIIPAFTEWRNTSVSTLLGHLPAKQSYIDPYLSPVSLQLPLDKGGAGPHYGFQGFPSKVFISTGTAEVSYDQHVTLAHRLAAGTKRQKPVYSGDRCSERLDPVPLAERPSYPRSAETEIDLSTLLANRVSQSSTPSLASLLPLAQYTPDGTDEKPNLSGCQLISPFPSESGMSTFASSTDSLKASHHYRWRRSSTVRPLSGSALPDRQLDQADKTNGKATVVLPDTVRANLLAQFDAQRASGISTLEDRQVMLHEAIGAPHEYLIFDYFEPERSRTWDEIAQWIDEE